MSKPLQRVIKRAVDMAAASAGLVLAAPVMATASCAILATMGRPILFRQERPGKDGRIFTLFKFRTMSEPKPGEAWLRTDAKRTTFVGAALRKTSVDELPSLLNVLRGDMSLVGPRPLLVDYLAQYTPRQSRRHEVPSGITGWAQVNGRESIPFSRRLELDVWYVENWSLLLDLKILLRTIGVTASGSGHYEGGETLESFDDLGFSQMTKGAQLN